MEEHKPAARTPFELYFRKFADHPLDAGIITQCYTAPNINGNFDKLAAQYAEQNDRPIFAAKLSRIPHLKYCQAQWEKANKKGTAHEGKTLYDLVKEFEHMRPLVQTDTPAEIDIAEIEQALRKQKYEKPDKRNAPAA